MNLDVAEKSFISLLNSIKDKDSQEKFLNWVETTYVHKEKCNNNGCNGSKEDNKSNTKADILLSCVKATIKKKIPFNATMRSEKIMYPTVGEDSHLNAGNCVHVDAFLYDEADVDALVEAGKLSEHYCCNCLSRNVEPLTFITHSASKQRLEHIFKVALPSLNGKVIVDVGSRLGAVLYGAYVYSEAKEIIGVEMNNELCKLQLDIIQKFKLGDRMEVLEGDISHMPEVIKRANVIVLNNVFEWFIPVEVQRKLWDFLYTHITPETIIVAAPPIEKSLELVDVHINVKEWIQVFGDQVYTDPVQTDEQTELQFYKVIKR